jgi:hypothetical protein
VKWLTDCSTTGNFFVGLVYFFLQKKGIWNGAGFNDINNFHKASGRHEKTQSHLHAITALKHLVSLQ